MERFFKYATDPTKSALPARGRRTVYAGRQKFDLFAERHERVHAKQRGLVGAAYARNAVVAWEERVDGLIEVMAEMMERVSQQDREGKVDVGVWLQLFAFGMCIVADIDIAARRSV